MNDNIQKRAVAIVGRPNVGKSSIFNRLGRRVAIVHSERGVTRDRMIQEIEWRGERFDLIDTGGLGILDAMENGGNTEHLEECVRRQIEIAVEDACVIILVTDIKAGLIPQDEAAAEFLRKSGKTIYIAANKADNPESEAGASDFDRLGFPVFPVSALHYRGFEPLMQAVIERLPPPADAIVSDPIKIAVAGRPNVGKSSFVNQLLGCDRVIVSETPGTTRDSIEAPFSIGSGADARHYVLIDTAGIRHSRKTRGAVERFSLKSAERGIERSDVTALLLDAILGPTAQDKKIAALILKHQKSCVMLINKWDLNRGVKEARYREALNEALPFLGFVPMVFVSAKTGLNVRRAIKMLEAAATRAGARISTPELNRVIRDAYERTPPPISKGKRLKIYYATQAGVRPITIALFVNYACRLNAAYESYLKGVLRRAFELEGAPVFFILRQK